MAVNNPFAARDQILQQIMQAPWLPQISNELQSVLEAEQEKRQRFYEEMSEEQKTEFINGEVIVQTPVKLRHSQTSDSLFSLLSLHVKKHNLGLVGHEKLLVCLARNDYEPDISFFEKEKAQNFKPNQMKFPAPDFVVEVLSESTEAVDRGIKFEDYALNQVGEYWIVDPERETVEQYLLRDNGYELLVKANTGTVKSSVVKGFEIPVRAIFDEAEHVAAAQALLVEK
jgi:Uma2 family endonuclease